MSTVLLTNTFTVPLDPEEAWKTLLDVPRIAPCMPGAALTGADGNTYQGRVKLKIGPLSVQYQGEAEIVRQDDAEHRLVISARGKEAKGNGTARADVAMTLHPGTAPGETRVDVATELDITGRAAQFGRSVINDVAGRLVGMFAANLAAKLAEPETGTAAETAASASASAGHAAEPSAGSVPAPQSGPMGYDTPPPAPAAAPARTFAPPPGSADDDALDAVALLLGSARTRAAIAVGLVVVGVLIGRMTAREPRYCAPR
ncbi:hypothetical protein GCM10023205_68030 [Yinghuangia aomiensis]|uniref:Carbon monoxide dehydrogenase subunit G n=1 Tax=Yinghuangia aomiensis TaxID=676205 RepID=A0ABP9I447_9ACTN